MEGTPVPTPALIVVDHFGRLVEGTLTRTEWFEHETDDTVEVVRYHRDLIGQAA